MMLLVNTVLTLLHVRYAVSWAYVDYIFVIIISAKIYVLHILSIWFTHNLRVRTCAEGSARTIWHFRLTSLRSSPSGFADKVASVSESFGRVSECKITAFSWILQKKTQKVNDRYDNPLKQSVLSCFCCNFFVRLYPPLPEQVYLIFVLTHRKINKSINQKIKNKQD